jgi:agmatinase
VNDGRPLPGGARQRSGPPYAGPITWDACHLLTDQEQLDERRPDVAVVGAPWDDGTTFRPGARFGPRALRADAYQPGDHHLDLGVIVGDHLDIVDYGDAICPPGLWDPTFTAICDRVFEVASRGIVPVVLGGDHSITYPSAAAVAAAVDGRLGMVHFDAHADTADEIYGNPASHGAPMRRLIESGAIAGRNFVQVGLRGYWPGPEVFDWMHAHELRWHRMEEMWQRGVTAVIDTAIGEALEGTDAIYLSVDIDVLDPSYAPGTGTPEPGGMSPPDLLRAVRRIAMETPLVALDVVEVSPPYDWAATTINNADRVIREVLAALAWKKAGRPQVPPAVTSDGR